MGAGGGRHVGSPRLLGPKTARWAARGPEMQRWGQANAEELAEQVPFGGSEGEAVPDLSPLSGGRWGCS